VVLGACSREGHVEFSVRLNHEPLTRVDVLVIPYDAIGIRDSLASTAEAPKPEFPTLETALDSFRRRLPPELEAVYRDWRAARDRVEALSDTLESMDRENQEYLTAYDRFRSLYEGLAAQEAQLERASRELSADERDLAGRAAAAADTLRRWEAETYAVYDSLAAVALDESGREVVTLTTGAEGTADAVLPPGRWWALLRAPQEENPFRDYLWYVPFTVSGLTPLRIPLTDETVRADWRR